MRILLARLVSSLAKLLLAALVLAWYPIAQVQPAPDRAVAGKISRQSDPKSTTFDGCTAEYAPAVNAEYEQQVVELVNAERRRNGLAPLKLISALEEAARYHATDMGTDDYFSHDTKDKGQDTVICGWSERVSNYYPDWSTLGENIAAGYESPVAVMKGWLDSPDHKENILRPSFWEIGVGYYSGSGSYSNYWVQDFGRRPDVYPIVINDEAASTDSRQVSLYLYGEWEEMRLRSDSESWSAWQPFQNSLDWLLPNYAGEHTVSVEFRSGELHAASSDTVNLELESEQAQLGNLPEAVSFLYSLADQRMVPTQAVLTPLNVSGNDTLYWSVTVSGGWFQVAPEQAQTPASIIITPSQFSNIQPGIYPGALTVTVTSPEGALGSPYTIALSLNVIRGYVREVFLPLATR